MNNPKTVQALDAAHWQRQLEILIEKYQVPGAVFGILRSDTASGGTGQEERVVVGAGVTNINTGQSVTPDTLFQIGSITKTWTATLVLQLVAEGKLDLDAPIRDVLPDFKLADENAAATITMRHLLTHTSGIDGDIFTDTGRGDDCVRKYVESLDTAAQLFAPGATWSYCNTALVIAGRVVEVLREMTWDAALSKYILVPLSLKATTTLPEQTALHRFAVGHQNQNGTPVLTPTFLLPRSCGPAGLITAAPDDVLSYARTFMPGGGQALLGADSLAAMLTPQVEMEHASQVADHMGIGWVLQSWGGVPTINHNGGTLGQNSMLRLFPEQGVVLFLAANGGEPQKMMRELFTEAAALLTGATMPAAFTPATDGDGSAFHEYEGFYEAAGVRIHIRAAGEATWHAAVMDTTGLFGEKEPDIFELAGSGPAGFGAAVPGTSDWAPLSFESLGDTRLLHFSGRSYPQIPTPS